MDAVDGNEIIVQEKQFFREHTKRYKLDPDGLMTWGLLKFLREKILRQQEMR